MILGDVSEMEGASRDLTEEAFICFSLLLEMSREFLEVDEWKIECAIEG